MKIVKLPQALIDLVETAEYLAQDDVEVADRFFDAFESTLKDIRNTSESLRTHPKALSLRSLRLCVGKRVANPQKSCIIAGKH